MQFAKPFWVSDALNSVNSSAPVICPTRQLCGLLDLVRAFFVSGRSVSQLLAASQALRRIFDKVLPGKNPGVIIRKLFSVRHSVRYWIDRDRTG